MAEVISIQKDGDRKKERSTPENKNAQEAKRESILALATPFIIEGLRQLIENNKTEGNFSQIKKYEALIDILEKKGLVGVIDGDVAFDVLMAETTNAIITYLMIALEKEKAA